MGLAGYLASWSLLLLRMAYEEGGSKIEDRRRRALDPPSSVLLLLQLEQPGGRQIVEAGHDPIGACRLEQRLVAQARHADAGHAAGLRGLDPRRRILDDETARWRQAQLGGGGEKDIWGRLAVREIAPAHIGVEQLQQRCVGADERIAPALWLLLPL